eukprot:9479446-Pyramimonas_sp.AAC.1
MSHSVRRGNHPTLAPRTAAADWCPPSRRMERAWLRRRRRRSLMRRGVDEEEEEEKEDAEEEVEEEMEE